MGLLFFIPPASPSPQEYVIPSTDENVRNTLLFYYSNSSTGTPPLVSKNNWTGSQLPSFHPIDTISHRVIEVREKEDLMQYSQNVLVPPKEREKNDIELTEAEN